LVVLFPEFVRLLPALPGRTDRGAPAVLHLLSASSSAQAVAQSALAKLTSILARVSGGRWGHDPAPALHELAGRSTARARAVPARSLVARLRAQQLLELAAHIAELEAALAALLQDDADGQRRQAIPGIGPSGAATIRAALGDVARCGRVDEVVADAGLDPRTRQSGACMGQKQLSTRGPGALRHALYLAACVAARCAPAWRARYQRLLARGRAKNEALTLLARALVRVIYHLLRPGEPDDPTQLNQPSPTAAG
jgi:hypothetical protein